MRHALPLALALRCGCNKPTVDAKNDATLEASMKSITAGMSEAERSAFGTDCATFAAPAIFKAAVGLAFRKDDSAPRLGPVELFKPLRVLTIAGVHAKAEEVRAAMKAKGG